jgi:transcriptional regulator with XRE-family HTH domain
MVSLILDSPHDIAQQIARYAQAKRLAFNLSQQSLSERSGVSFGVIKKFERTGKISLESLLKIALVLECLDEFDVLFKSIPQKNASLDEMINEKKRKRGRQ